MSNSKLKVTELGKSSYDIWDKFVDESPNGDIFCKSWWLDAITKSNFKILVVINCKEIQAGIPLAYDNNGKINEPPLTRTLGPIFKRLSNISNYSQRMLNRKWLNLLLDKIDKKKVFQFCTHHNYHDWLTFRWKGYKQTTRYTYLIDNNETEDEIWQKFTQNRKRDIKIALGNNLHVKISDDFKLLYKMIELTYKRQGKKFGLRYNDFKRLDVEIKNRNMRRIFITYDEHNQPHAALYVVFNSKSAYYLLCGSNPKLRHLKGNILAFWQAIKYFRTRTNYSNFGGSDIERIENFLKQFGGKLTQYFHIFTEKPIIKKVPIVKEIPMVKQTPLPSGKIEHNWKYHFDHLMHHSYCLFDIIRKKILGKKK